ncbi:MAG: ATP-binding protein, partial [Planctomycetes bacterium]|nr:ATP-binding protein [Planctomycetota bacterium]
MENHANPTKKGASHRLIKLKVPGGFLDQLHIPFSPGLNCIIGGRGTSKTTVLELIRFALDIPGEQGAQKRFDELVKANLGPGRVQLAIQTKDGLRYTITRAYGEPPLVFTDTGQPTEINLRAGNLFHADLFSLNQIENVADCPASQLALIDSFDLPAINRHNAAIQRLANALAANSRELIPAEAGVFALREETVELSTIEEQLKAGGQAVNPDVEPAREAARLKGLRERERTTWNGFGTETAEFIQSLVSFKGWLAAELDRQIIRELRDGPNRELFAQATAVFTDIAARLDNALDKAMAVCGGIKPRHEEFDKTLLECHARQEMAYRELIEKQKALMDAASERSALEKRRNGLLGKKAEMDALAKKAEGLRTARRQLLAELSEERCRRFRLRAELARRINDTLMPDVRVNIHQDGSREDYDARLEGWLKGGKVQKAARAAIAQKLWPQELARLCAERDSSALVTQGQVSERMAQIVFEYLGQPEIIHQMETLELADDPMIELHDGGQYKRAWALSTGQKCTAVLPILLMEHERPLLVDQPEDNLDNRFVSDKVVKTLRAVKERRQI